MNPFDALVAASDRLVVWLQPIATEFARLIGMSAYRLAAFLYRASVFLMAGLAIIPPRAYPVLSSLWRPDFALWAV